MKRILVLALVALIVLAAVACNPTLESRLNETNTLVATRAIAAVDRYLDGDSTPAEAQRVVMSEISSVDESDDQSLFIGSRLAILSAVLTRSIHGTEDVAGIREARNSVAELAGIPTR